mmetsp:Transcript_8297/g.26402  ORF Transcript_8297/g.26402 Transcript_8297/m.26402 type:complete len:211 (-) Transcript_8297:903-1535(-)
MSVLGLTLPLVLRRWRRPLSGKGARCRPSRAAAPRPAHQVHAPDDLDEALVHVYHGQLVGAICEGRLQLARNLAEAPEGHGHDGSQHGRGDDASRELRREDRDHTRTAYEQKLHQLEEGEWKGDVRHLDCLVEPEHAVRQLLVTARHDRRGHAHMRHKLVHVLVDPAREQADAIRLGDDVLELLASAVQRLSLLLSDRAQDRQLRGPRRV